MQGLFRPAMVVFVTLVVVAQAVCIEVGRANFLLVDTAEGGGIGQCLEAADSELSDHNTFFHLGSPKFPESESHHQIDSMAPLPKISEPPTSATINATIKPWTIQDGKFMAPSRWGL